VVAAVFSYVVLGAGFFTTQTAQATVQTGAAQASSGLEVVGNVVGIAIAASPSRLTYVNVSVATTAGGSSMDLSQMVVSYIDSNGARNPNVANNSGGIGSCIWTHEGDTNILSYDSIADWDVHWCVSQRINDMNPGAENTLLEPGEIWVISVALPPTTTPNTKMTLNFQPAVGAVLPLSRTVPGGITKVQAIH
ncbi:MAG: flagellin, partial [Methanomicrobiales archaeon]|nr:flagellin [Methanomicrobiales archaeon]